MDIDQRLQQHLKAAITGHTMKRQLKLNLHEYHYYAHQTGQTPARPTFGMPERGVFQLSSSGGACCLRSAAGS